MCLWLSRRIDDSITFVINKLYPSWIFCTLIILPLFRNLIFMRLCNSLAVMLHCWLNYRAIQTLGTHIGLTLLCKWGTEGQGNQTVVQDRILGFSIFSIHSKCVCRFSKGVHSITDTALLSSYMKHTLKEVWFHKSEIQSACQSCELLNISVSPVFSHVRIGFARCKMKKGTGYTKRMKIKSSSFASEIVQHREQEARKCYCDSYPWNS